MVESLRKPLFIIAAVLLALAVLIELGSPLLERISGRVGSAASRVDGAVASIRSIPQFKDVPESEVKAKLSVGTDKPPGKGVPYMVLLDGLVLFTVLLIGTGILVPERVQARVQGIVTLIVSLLVLLAAIGKIFIAVAALILMVTLLLAIPFGTIIYLIGYGSFDRESASVILSVTMTLKFLFAGCLAFAHQGFLKMKGLVLIVLTSIVAGIVVSFLHGLVPGILVSITDAIAGIIVAVLAALWAIFFLIGSIPSIVKSIKLRA
jgi:hypothetical protein